MGNQPRLGIAGQSDDDDVVQGIVLMRRGAGPCRRSSGVLAKVDKMTSGRAAGRHAHRRIYDRSALVDITTHTVLHDMVMGVALIFLVQWLFLGDLRSAMIVSTTIPFALLFAVVVLVLSGESANLFSIGAIDFGIIVDATVIIVENIFRHLSEVGHTEPSDAAGRPRASTPSWRRSSMPQPRSRSDLLLGHHHRRGLCRCSRCRRRATSSARWPAPTPTPSLAACWPPSRSRPRSPPCCTREGRADAETRAVRTLRRGYDKLRDASLPIAGAAMAAGRRRRCARRPGRQHHRPGVPAQARGGRHVDPAIMPATISLRGGNGYATRMRRVIKSFPEAETVISQHGRPNNGTVRRLLQCRVLRAAPAVRAMAQGLDKDGLIAKINEALTKAFPGIEFTFSNSSRTTSRRRRRREGREFGQGLRRRPGDAGQGRRRDQERHRHRARRHRLAVSASLGQPTIKIDIDRAKAARYGLDPGDVDATVQAAIGGRRRATSTRMAATPLPDDRPPGVALSREHRGDQAHPDRRPGRQRHGPDAAGQLATVEPGVGRLLHLPRAAGALRPHEVLGPRPRSRQRHPEAQERVGREGQVPAAIASNGSASSATSRTPCSG